MTDGILLAEIQRDPISPDTHAHHRRSHERSLNVDFLLVLPQQLLRADPT